MKVTALRNRPRWSWGKVLPILALLVLGAAAGGPAEADTQQVPAGSQAPSIGIVSPEPGASLPFGEARVSVDTSGFIIDPGAIGMAAIHGRGHWHLYVDGVFVSANAVSEVKLERLPPGPHHLRVSLANNDHSPLNPAVEDSVTIDVGEASAADETVPSSSAGQPNY